MPKHSSCECRELIKSKLVACEIIQRHISVHKGDTGARKVMTTYHLWAEAAGSQQGGRHMRASSAVASIGLRMMLSLLLVRP